MLYLLAAAGLATAALLLWRAGSPQLTGARTGPPVAPDDDPEFLATLDQHKPGDEEH